MLLRLFLALVSLTLGNACFGQLEPSGCKSYEPALVSLHGTLVRQTLPGPPEYADIRRGDKAERFWFINLDNSICVDKDKSQPDLNPKQKNIHKVQLVLPAEGYEKCKALLGKRVVVAGTLFGGHTGHHHTPVLLTVNNIERAHWK